MGAFDDNRYRGKKFWAIAEGYIPKGSNGPLPQMESHETICILNISEKDVWIQIMIYFSDKEPVGPYEIEIKSHRTKHIRLNDLKDPEPIPLDTDFACTIESEVPIIVQHTRLDSRQSENALLSTIAYYE